jgi:hypothetical protein
MALCLTLVRDTKMTWRSFLISGQSYTYDLMRNLTFESWKLPNHYWYMVLQITSAVLLHFQFPIFWQKQKESLLQYTTHKAYLGLWGPPSKLTSDKDLKLGSTNCTQMTSNDQYGIGYGVCTFLGDTWCCPEPLGTTAQWAKWRQIVRKFAQLLGGTALGYPTLKF